LGSNQASIDGEWTGSRLELDRDELRKRCACLPIGPVRITVEKPKAQRSLDQNAYLHAGPFPILAEYFGYSIPEVKLVLMGECWGWHTVYGKELPIKPSTADMTVEECTYFIDWLLPWAMTEHGVSLPLPDERVAQELSR